MRKHQITMFYLWHLVLPYNCFTWSPASPHICHVTTYLSSTLTTLWQYVGMVSSQICIKAEAGTCQSMRHHY